MQFTKAAAAAVAALAAAHLPVTSAQGDPLIAESKGPGVVAESHWSDGFEETGCLNALYQTSGVGLDPLQCNATKKKGKFWRKVHVQLPKTCIDGRRLAIVDLHFEAYFKDVSKRDFSVYTYTGEANSTAIIGKVPTIHGDQCVVQTLTEGNEHVSPIYPNASIANVDLNDTCRDIVLAQGETLTTTIDFAETFDIPCTDYLNTTEIADALANNVTRTAKLQVCTTWRTPEEDIRCNALGPYPSSPDECWCEYIDLGVEIIDASDAVPACSPDKPTTPGSSNSTTPPTSSPTTSCPTSTIDFDDVHISGNVAAIPASYRGFEWEGAKVLNRNLHPNSGYFAGTVSPENCAFVFKPIAMHSTTPFSVVSLHVTPAWNQNMTLLIQAFRGSTPALVGTYEAILGHPINDYPLSDPSSSFISLEVFSKNNPTQDFADINRLTVEVTEKGSEAGVTSRSGTHVVDANHLAIDNIVVCSNPMPSAAQLYEQISNDILIYDDIVEQDFAKFEYLTVDSHEQEESVNDIRISDEIVQQEFAVFEFMTFDSDEEGESV